MRRRIVLLLILLGMAAVFPAGAEAAGPLTEADFVFVYAGQAYHLGEPALPLLQAVQAAEGAMRVAEAESCMFTGVDREFESDTLLIATYPIGRGGADVLETILVVGGEHQTARGISIGDAMDDVAAAYGASYTLDYNQVVYALGDPLTEPVLIFILDLDTGRVASFFVMRNTSA
jgi:hypothetical protein